MALTLLPMAVVQPDGRTLVVGAYSAEAAIRLLQTKGFEQNALWYLGFRQSRDPVVSAVINDTNGNPQSGVWISRGTLRSGMISALDFYRLA